MNHKNNNTALWDLCRFTLPALAGLSLLTLPGYASDTRAATFSLSVRPSICVSYNSEKPCAMAMEVSWEGGNAADVCLREAMAVESLHCWEDASRGSVEVGHANTGDVRYQLVEEASQGVLAEAEVKVINRDLRSSRKRRRHVWSIL